MDKELRATVERTNRSLLAQLRRLPSNSLGLVLVIVVFGGLGSYLLLSSHAATPVGSIESENGTISSAASSVNDTSASAGKAIKFGQGSTGGGAQSCPPLPAYPDSNCTGVPPGTVLQRVPNDVTSGTCWHWDNNLGGIRTDCAGAQLIGLDISSFVTNYSAWGNITVKNTLIRGTGVGHGTDCLSIGPGSTVTDTEIGGGADGTTLVGCIAIRTAGNGPNNITITRVDIHHALHGFKPNGGTTIIDSYVHYLVMGDAVDGHTDDHTDGAFIEGGSDIAFTHDHFYSAANNSDIFVQDYSHTAAGVSNITITNSLFEAGPIRNSSYGQSIYGVGIENKNFQGRQSTVHVTNNKFSKDDWSANPIEAPIGAVVSGNVYPDSTSADADTRFVPVAY